MKSLRAGLFAAGLCALSATGLVGCAVGQGEGFVTSDLLFAEGCADGPLDLKPDFFATNPFDNTQMIRLQRGDKLQETSDGVMIVVSDVAAIRGDDGSEGLLGTSIRVGMPPGVAAPGVPIVADPDPPIVSMTLYLNDSCHEQDVSLQSMEGTINFTKLFNGEINERNRDERLTEASFDVIFADPRTLPPDATSLDDVDPALLSRVTGSFSFLFRRGQPAQPFP